MVLMGVRVFQAGNAVGKLDELSTTAAEATERINAQQEAAAGAPAEGSNPSLGGHLSEEEKEAAEIRQGSAKQVSAQSSAGTAAGEMLSGTTAEVHQHSR